MKNKYCLKLVHTPLVALALVTGSAFAGEVTTTAPAPMTPATEDVISGILKLDFNSHFISYGNDVWGDGSTMSEPTFNPNLELYFALPADLTLTLGTWWDVNSSKGETPAVADSTLGGRIQEIDVYAGLAYTIDKFTVGVTYQAWMYGNDTENILDVKFAYDTILSPTLTLHSRLDAGAAGGDAGTGDEGNVLVLGLSHGIEAGPVTISFPVNIAYFIEDGFHSDEVSADADAGEDTDNGFGFASVGVSASLPLTPYIGEGFGEWSLNGGLTFYMTDDDVIPNNPRDNFLTAGLGLAVAF